VTWGTSTGLLAWCAPWLAVTLGLAACGDTDANDSSHAAESTARTDCPTIENVVDQILCFADEAEAAGRLAACDAASAEGVRFQCYAIYAERAQTVEPCRLIPTEDEDLSDLRDACVSDVAKVTKQPDLCEEIGSHGLRDSCWLQVFRETGDAGLCDRIEDARLRSLCTGEPVYVE